MRKRTNHRVGHPGLRRTPGDRQFVGALHRGLEILRCFRADDGPLGNQELAQRTGFPKATVSRLTYTLSKLGYLVYLPEEGKYRMGVPVLGLGFACLGGMKIRETMQPHMQEIADYAGDGALVALGGRDDLSMIYIGCARSVGVISLTLNVGSRISLGRSSMGRAYLAGLDEAEREALMEQLRVHYGDDRWEPIRQGIHRAIAQIRDQGYCMHIGDWHPHVNSIAVPVRYPQPGLETCAMNIGGPAYVLTPERLRTLGPRLVEVVQRVLSLTNA